MTILKLNLYDNNICAEGVAQIGEGVSKLLNLTHLNMDIRENGISAKESAIICDSISNFS